MKLKIKSLLVIIAFAASRLLSKRLQREKVNRRYRMVPPPRTRKGYQLHMWAEAMLLFAKTFGQPQTETLRSQYSHIIQVQNIYVNLWILLRSKGPLIEHILPRYAWYFLSLPSSEVSVHMAESSFRTE